MEIVKDLPPTLLMSYLDRAQEAHQRGDARAAVRNYTRGLMIDPDCVGALNNLAMILAEEGYYSAAVVLAQRAVAQNPDQTFLLANLGAILAEMEEYEASAGIFDRLTQEHPNNHKFWHNLAMAWMPVDPARMLTCYKRAEELAPRDPMVLRDLGLGQLMLCQWDAGFANWRRSGLNTDDASFSILPEWRGESLVGKTIVVYHEQGMGDTIQFCRFLRLLEAERIVLAVPSPLVRLMRMAKVADEIVDFADPASDGADYQIPLMFAWAYRSISDQLSNDRIPYLKAPERGPRVFRGENTNLMVGICWAGHAAYGNDRWRSMPFEKLLPLAATPGVQLVSLQKGPNAVDVNTKGANALVNDLSGQIGDLADTAFIIENIDLVVSVDTAPLHVAGALGKPTIAMLPYNRCWRWSRGTDETPFYPSMRLITQPSPGDWTSVVKQVHEAVIAAIGDRRVPPEPQTDYELLNVPGRVA